MSDEYIDAMSDEYKAKQNMAQGQFIGPLQPTVDPSYIRSQALHLAIQTIGGNDWDRHVMAARVYMAFLKDG